MKTYKSRIEYNPVKVDHNARAIQGECPPDFISTALGSFTSSAMIAADKAGKKMVLEVSVQYEDVE